MTENHKTIKNHVSRVLGIRFGEVENLWRGAREAGRIIADAPQMGVPSKIDKARFLGFIVMREFTGKSSDVVRNSPLHFEEQGVIAESFGGITKRVEIPAAAARSILTFGDCD